jgi:hypothetical protein
MKFGIGKLIGIGIVVAVILGGIGLYNKFNALQMQGVDYETQLNAQYLDNQNELSAYKSTIYEQAGIANLKSDKLDQIITDAVKGRYEGKTSAQVGQGQLFSAITEAYPNLDLNVYDKIVEQIAKGREGYKNKQTKLLGMLQTYDKWRSSGIIQSRLISLAGFPSNTLEARIGTSVKRGADARDQMYLIVLTSDTKKAYETGVDDPMTFPGGKK